MRSPDAPESRKRASGSKTLRLNLKTRYRLNMELLGLSYALTPVYINENRSFSAAWVREPWTSVGLYPPEPLKY